MKTPMSPLILPLVISLLPAWAGCGEDPTTPSEQGITSDITVDTTWTADKEILLKGHIFVKNATLTIQPGTVIKGDKLPGGTSLIVTTTGKIVAEGRQDAPIVFTTSLPKGQRTAGAWGGVVLLGRAPLNVSGMGPGGTETIEGFDANTEGIQYGGTDPNHNCGTLKYVRIEFAGFEKSQDNELNGLTLGGCGSQTKLDYIQVHKGADDGIEFFGGTANLSHAVISQTDDDGIDADFGYSGKVQFVVVQQSAAAGNHGFEWDNNQTGPDYLPRTSPTIWNATLVGSGQAPGTVNQGGMLLRRGTAGIMSNVIVTAFANFAVDVADWPTVQQARATPANLAIQNSYFFQNANAANGGWPPNFDVKTTGGTSQQNDCDAAGANCLDEATHFAPGNTTTTDPALADPKNLTAPNFAPKTGSPVLTGGGTPPSDGFFDTTATFIGAVGTADWTQGWTAYPAD